LSRFDSRRDGTIWGMTAWTRIGLWRREDHPEWPDPADLVDPSWDVEERSLVATYLENGAASPSFMIWTLSDGSFEVGERCRLCEGDVLITFNYDTDGTYVWPDGLGHYVEVHSVRLPSQVVNHILQQQPFDFDAIQARAWDRIMTRWHQDEHDTSWWQDVTPRSAD